MTKTVATFQVPPVQTSVLVPCDPARAFRAFTSEIAQWWPIKTHSVGRDKAQNIVLETRPGGRVFEIDAAGSESDWGRILEWSPPHGFAMTWHPGRAAGTHQVLELSFKAEAQGTRVTLVHRGWEVLGADAQAKRDDYAGGWEAILSRDFAPYCTRMA